MALLTYTKPNRCVCILFLNFSLVIWIPSVCGQNVG